ncbi:hypothetical protein CEUSTIGMA_g3054.t1 [Chlamydomonas eustigma]|uniref:SAM-dependent MTase RsmB/NOP-type domain-containing protein n=1 Tax=Chlamydomonas eustigma TaxID=1157962 RepID=A0A250WYM9_9CHLO|nr:hypothetical protein CEUSTIGMA_g3054.t1 [Chlamydomonas eustigma]|eukprot:GAX75610.1 hypothetical protein CEUSTIGMA_g3054.t1 [Chlamydomonas eustigma]
MNVVPQKRHKGGRGSDRNLQDHTEKRPRSDAALSMQWLDTASKRNDDFEEYYKEQDIVPEGEWESFIKILGTELPVTFRINGSGRFADNLRDKLQSDFFSHFRKGDLMVADETIQVPKPLSWYPNNYAWHMSFSRQQLRKLPLLGEIHEFMKKANDAGSISRQEAVSMVPPLFLDVQPHHAVLDMCAAPGSKTQQLLEALHSGDSFPSGFVVANDSDLKRCNLLTHQTKRVCSPCLMVTNHSAEQFPEVKRTGADSHQMEPLRFDRILADVPCSGDGTLRKAPDIWRRWTVANGNGLHLLQLRIALKGCKLLKVGGRMVYSTCTFNPIEDEAVVSELLEVCRGSIELVDVSGEMTALKRLPGKKAWKVRDKVKWYSNWEEAQSAGAKLDPSMFPSPSKAELPLERCMRFLPHHQDTGGFFVCVLRKVSELPTDIGVPSAKQRQNGVGVEEETAAAEHGGVPEGQPEVGILGEDQEEDADMVVDDKKELENIVQEELEELEDPSGEIRDSSVQKGQDSNTLSPVEIARQAAEQAIEAAQRAVDALGAQDLAACSHAEADAQRAGARAGVALDMNNKAGKKQADQKKREYHKGKSKTTATSRDGAVPSQIVSAKGADSVEGEEDEGAGGMNNAPRFEPSWIRGGGGRNRTLSGRGNAIDPIVPMEDPEVLQPLLEYFGLSPDFPIGKQLISRSLEVARPKRLYFVCTALHDILVRDIKEQLKVAAIGLKVFERQEIKDSNEACFYRLAQEGLPFLLPHIAGQRVQLCRADFLTLLREKHLMMPDAFVVEHGGASSRPVIKDAALLKQLQGCRFGCVVAELRHTAAQEASQPGSTSVSEPTSAVEPCSSTVSPPSSEIFTPAAPSSASGGGALMANAPLALSAWKGKASLAIMVDKNECAQMIEKIAAAQGTVRNKMSTEISLAEGQTDDITIRP